MSPVCSKRVPSVLVRLLRYMARWGVVMGGGADGLPADPYGFFQYLDVTGAFEQGLQGVSEGVEVYGVVGGGCEGWSHGFPADLYRLFQHIDLTDVLEQGAQRAGEVVEAHSVVGVVAGGWWPQLPGRPVRLLSVPRCHRCVRTGAAGRPPEVVEGGRSFGVGVRDGGHGFPVDLYRFLQYLDVTDTFGQALEGDPPNEVR